MVKLYKHLIILNCRKTVMYSRQKESNSYFPNYQDSRNPYLNNPRPQTPHGSNSNNLLGHSRSLNRSYGRLQVQPSAYVQQQGAPRGNISRSRVSVGSSHASQLDNLMADHIEVFPQELVFLLRNEEKNINNLKEKIEHEKTKVENDFSVFRTEIDHILEDIKISVQAQLDLVYKTYITKYAQLKGEVQELRIMRKQILMNNPNNNYNSNFANPASVSNKDLISEIQKDAENMRNFKVYEYLSELQKQKLEPINQLSEELVMIGAVESPFYRNKQLNIKLKDVKQNFGSIIKEVFDNLTDYVLTPQLIFRRQKQEEENSRAVLKEFQAMQASKHKAFDVHFPINSRTDEKPAKEMKKQKQINEVSSNEQGCRTRWCEDVKLNRLEKIQTDHSDCILCIYFVGDKYIATGSKDTSINIYSLDGKKVRNLRGHQASICCLGSVRNLNGDLYLASGSDHGCSSLILWDLRSWTISNKIQAHTAAVTGILDLQDGRHVATGSYDKKINVFNMVKNQIVMSLNNNKTSVTGMIMTVDKSRLVTSGLDKSVTVWNIFRNKGAVEQIQSEKIINCDELICQLQPSLLRPQLIFCAARDGSLKMLNIVSGKVEKSYTVNANSLIQLVAIEREMNVESPLLITCSAKDSSLILTKMQSGLSSLIKLSSNLGIDYGCGIGPKIVLSQLRDGLMAIVNQKSGSRQFSLFEIDLK